jgi:hypothetical protein
MKPGAKYQFFVPSELAYGERGAGSDIGPNAMLTFDVELLEVVAPTPTPKPATEVSPKAAKPATSPSPSPSTR